MTASPNELDTDVRLAVFRCLSDSGRAPSVAEIAQALAVAPAEVEASFGRLHAGRVIVLKPGTSELWMANPFSAVETGFRVSAGDSQWFGNCIWDSLGILALAKRDGLVETECPDCDGRLRVEVANGKLQPNEAVVHFAVPAAHWWDDIGYT